MKFQLTQYVLLASLTFITGSIFATTRYTGEATFNAALGAAPATLESFEPVSGGNASLSNASEATFLTGYTGSSFDQLFVGVIDSTEFTSIAFHGTTPDDSIYFDRMQTALAAPEPVVPEPKIYAMLLTGLGLLGVSVHRRRGKAILRQIF
jgi:hypothetical protein